MISAQVYGGLGRTDKVKNSVTFIRQGMFGVRKGIRTHTLAPPRIFNVP